MNNGAHLRDLLRPLGVYRLEGGVGAGELAGIGEALDRCQEELERVEREMLLTTAQDRGLEAVESLLARRPVAASLERRRAALAALLRIGGDSFTLAAINDELAGCGLHAVVSEGDGPGMVEVRFPEVPGIPEGFAEMRAIIEDILPCHLGIEYVYWYATWAILEERFATWGALEAGGYTWGRVEKLVKADMTEEDEA